MELPQAIDIRISMLRLAPQCFAFTSFSIRVRVRVWYYFIFRSGYWSGNRTFSPVAIGPAIGHVVKHQSDSCYIYAFYNAFCAMSSFQSDSGIFSPVGSILAA